MASNVSKARARVCPLDIQAQLQLTPAQRAAATRVQDALVCSSVIVLKSEAGFGRTTTLREVWRAAGGAFLGMQEFVVQFENRGQIEETLLDLMQSAITSHEVIFFDDLHLVQHVCDAMEYPRTNLLEVVLTAVLSRAEALGRKIVFGSDRGQLASPVAARAVVCSIEDFGKEDYASIGRGVLGSKKLCDMNVSRVFRYAPSLSAYQLKNAFGWLSNGGALQADRMIEYLREHNMASNVDIEEVRPVSWKDLRGMDDLIRTLEAKIALPLENDQLAAELGLKPKRGVLLAGPPGTGKTTIGRALAHRLHSKFFLIDGTMIAGTCNFYDRVRAVFEAAKKNAPSIIFIDDGDVLFEQNQERGLYRYLLTMLDGLESASAERVCVMMTAMDARCVPPAMLRSGRIELWLETRMPDEAARLEILSEKLSSLPEPLRSTDAPLLARESRGLTGADLKAVIEDGKLLFAYDKANGNQLRAVEDYFIEAIASVRGNQRSYCRTQPSRVGVAPEIGFAGCRN